MATPRTRHEGASWIQEVTARDPVVALFLPEVTRIATSDAPALLVGEPGSGRELIARAVHNLSRRAPGPFVVVDCADASGELLEAELLGVDTGERPRKLGAFEQADGGTLYLSEIGDLTEPVQEDLMRLIQRHQTMRLYAHRPTPADVRCVASTSVDLQARAAAGFFRVDLLALLSTHVVRLCPLRERSQDVPTLATKLLAACRHGGGPERFSPDAEAALRAHPWPGNVHELRDVVQTVCGTATGRIVETDDLPPIFRGPAAQAPSLRDVELAELRRAMQQAGGTQRVAARRLGLTRWALARRLQKYGLTPPRA